MRSGKDRVPVWSDGTPVALEEITYKNMETGMEGGQFNKEAKPLFDRADELLWEDIRPLMEGTGPDTGHKEK